MCRHSPIVGSHVRCQCCCCHCVLGATPETRSVHSAQSIKINPFGFRANPSERRTAAFQSFYADFENCCLNLRGVHTDFRIKPRILTTLGLEAGAWVAANITHTQDNSHSLIAAEAATAATTALAAAATEAAAAGRAISAAAAAPPPPPPATHRTHTGHTQAQREREREREKEVQSKLHFAPSLWTTPASMRSACSDDQVVQHRPLSISSREAISHPRRSAAVSPPALRPRYFPNPQAGSPKVHPCRHPPVVGSHLRSCLQAQDQNCKPTLAPALAAAAAFSALLLKHGIVTVSGLLSPSTLTSRVSLLFINSYESSGGHSTCCCGGRGHCSQSAAIVWISLSLRGRVGGGSRCCHGNRL